MSSLFQGLVANGLVPVGLSPIAGAVAHYIAGVGIGTGQPGAAVTNLFLWSQNFETVWIQTAGTITSNVAVAPDGTLTADRKVEGVANNVQDVTQSIAHTAGIIYTVSWHAKKGERSYCAINHNAAGGYAASYFNLDTGVVVSSGAGHVNTIVDVGNGWYRCTNTYTASTTISIFLQICVSDTGARVVYAGDTSKGIYLWGAQFQTGATATPYIPTYSAPVTAQVGTVYQWNDQSGSNNHLLQATAANQPINLPYSGTVYGWLPGTISEANSFSTPDAPANQLTGNIDLRGRVAANDWTPAGRLLTIVSKWAGPGNRSWLFQLNNTGRLQLVTSSNGSALVTFVSTVNPTVSDGQDLWVRATLVVDNGAAGRTVVFYTSPDGFAWTPLGDPVTLAGVGLFAGTAPVAVGIQNLVTDPFAGKIYRAQIRNGINGPVVVDFNPGDAAVPVSRNDYVMTEDFSNAEWRSLSSGTVTKTPNYGLAPDGTMTACRLQCSATGLQYFGQGNATGIPLSPWNMRVWIRSISGSSVGMFFRQPGGVNVNATVTTGWQRLGGIVQNASGFQPTWILEVNSDLLVWHPQVNPGDADTPYVRTLGVAANWNSATTGEPWTINATGAKQAQLVQKSSVLFDGVDDFLKTAAFTLNQPTTVVARLRQVTWTLNDRFFDGNADNSGFLFQNPASPQLIANALGAGVTLTAAPVNSYATFTTVFNGATSSIRVDSGTPATGNAGTGSMGGLTLAKPGAVSDAFGNIQVEEFAVFPRALTTTEINNIVDYFNGAAQAFFRGVRLATSTAFSFVPESGQARSFIEGIAVTQTDGSIIYVTQPPEVIPSGGLGRLRNGAVCVTNLPAEVYHQGVPLHTDGRLCISGITLVPWGIGVPGTAGFGVGICPSLPAGFTALTGYDNPLHANYGNYQYSDGSVMVWVPAFYYKWGTGANGFAINEVSATSDFPNEAAANADGYALHRAFYDGGSAKSGFFVDKYINSLNGTIASSIANGIVLSSAQRGSLATAVFSSVTGGSNTYGGAIGAAKARGANFFCSSRFIFSALAMLSYAHAQASTTTTYCAWYNNPNNFPKGCNNSALGDVQDVTVLYTVDGNGTFPTGKTGSGVAFAKTTHNGQACGVADLNGLVWEVNPGLTSNGTNLYILKTSATMKNVTGGNTLATDLWGATGVAALYDNLGTSYEAWTGSSTTKLYGSAAQVFSAGTSGNAWNWAGAGGMLAAGVGGTNPFGNDIFYDYKPNEMCPVSSSNWGGSSDAGVWALSLGNTRTDSSAGIGFRSALYL